MGKRNKRSVPFFPHEFQPVIESFGSLPQVVIMKEAYDVMRHYVDLAEEEVGWLGTCVREGNTYIIQEVFLFKQNVSSSRTEISTDGLAEISSEIMKRPDGMRVMNNLRFWGHSHHTMGTSPSGQDDQQMRDFSEQEMPWALRGIFNKLGRAEFTLFLYDAGYVIRDIEWELRDPAQESMLARIRAEMMATLAAPASSAARRLSESIPPMATIGCGEIRQARCKSGSPTAGSRSRFVGVLKIGPKPR